MENENKKATDSEDVQDSNDRDPDPNDEIPVPIVMTPAEIAERAEVVEALRHTPPAISDDDLQP